MPSVADEAKNLWDHVTELKNVVSAQGSKAPTTSSTSKKVDLEAAVQRACMELIC